MANNNIEGRQDEQFNQAFGEHTGISKDCREDIRFIKNNVEGARMFRLGISDARRFTDLAWRLFGRYIANKSNLREVNLDDCSLTDEKMTLLFSELVHSSSMQRLDLHGNEFGIDGARNMIPLLKNSPDLSILYLSGNTNINSECFEVLISALDETSVKKLYFYGCNITNISALSSHNLPNLQALSLRDSDIGREGYIILSNLLQKEGSTLTTLYLGDMDMGDDGAKIIAASLKHNTKLKELHLNKNNIKREGYKALTKLLVDISSIESTYNSNHTLSLIHMGGNTTTRRLKSLVESACKKNGRSSNPEAAGRAKVIKYQLDSQKRKELCELQGIEYSSIGNLLADIEPILLPNIFALIGNTHGQSELYMALVHTAPQLLSYIDKRALIRNEIAKNTSQASDITAQIAVLTQQLSVLNAKNDQLSTRWEMIDIGDSIQSAGGEGNSNSMKVGDKKRKVQH